MASPAASAPVTSEGPGGSPSVIRPPEGFGQGCVSGGGRPSVIFPWFGTGVPSACSGSGTFTVPGPALGRGGDPAGVVSGPSVSGG